MENLTERVLKIDSTAQSKYFLQTTPRFLKDAVKGAGFSFYQSISEFIDNSITQGRAKRIVLSTKLNKDGYYNLTIEDDGVGIPKDKIFNLLENVGSGSINDYNSDSISYYGVGMKYAMINLCDYGEIMIESVNDGYKSSLTMVISEDEAPYLKEPKFERSKSKSYTKISIPNLITNQSKISSNQITGLLKFIGAIYFPHIDNDNKLEVVLKHNNKEQIVEFTDPLYRNLSEEEGVLKNDDTCTISTPGGDKVIYIRGRYFNKNFSESNYSQYDNKQGSVGFAATRSGVYFRLNGRYITLGDGEFFKSSDQQKRNHLRIEVDLDRDLIPIMGVGFNKSKINLSRDNTLLKEFISKFDYIVTWGEGLYGKQRREAISDSEQDPDSVKEREELNKDLSALRKRTDVDGLGEYFPTITKKEKKEAKEPKGTKIRPSGLEYQKNGVEFRYESTGALGVALEYGKEMGKVIVTMNMDHPFFKSYSLKDKDTKKVIDIMIMSFIEGLVSTSIDHNSIEAKQMIEDLLINYSNRLRKWFKLVY
jgi:hypothetical protein